MLPHWLTPHQRVISYILQWNTPEVFAVSKYGKQEVAQLSFTMIRAKSIKNRMQADVTQ